MAKKIDELVESVAKLTVLELSDLVSALQEKLGVSATPQVTVAAPATSSEAVAETPQSGASQTVIMTNSGANKINVIKALREINQNWTLMEAKKMTETVPVEILKDVKAEDVKSASDKLKAAGATVELK